MENIAIGTYEFEVLNGTEDIYTMTLCNKHFTSVEGKNGTFDVNLTTAVGKINYFMFLKALVDTFGNCQRPVFSLKAIGHFRY